MLEGVRRRLRQLITLDLDRRGARRKRGRDEEGNKYEEGAVKIQI
jgi:hypothetical protein